MQFFLRKKKEKILCLRLKAPWNLVILTFVVIVGTPQVEMELYDDFTPNGLSGVAKGSGVVFFAFLGFDMVACLSEEVKDPQVSEKARKRASLSNVQCPPPTILNTKDYAAQHAHRYHWLPYPVDDCVCELEPCCMRNGTYCHTSSHKHDDKQCVHGEQLLHGSRNAH